MSEPTCRCGKPTRDAAYVCDDCSRSLSVALGEIPWLEAELEVSISRQRGVDYRALGGTGGAEKPSPVHWSASEARGHLRGVLVAWVRFCAEEKVRNASPHHGIPEDTLTAVSRWLMWRVDGLGLLDIGPEAVDEITSAVAHCHRHVDRPADRQYLGDCDACPEGRLYARHGGTWARCNACGDTVDAAQLRTKLLDELDDRLCTAAEIARLSTYLGLKADRDQVRNRINQWHKRGRIHSESMFDEAAFRFGIVWRLLAHEDQAKAS